MPIVFFSSCFFFYHISPRFIFGVLVPLHKFTPFIVSECFFCLHYSDLSLAL